MEGLFTLKSDEQHRAPTHTHTLIENLEQMPVKMSRDI